MTRETKIGVALMVLLVGVFGAVVYKKWNGRQPTAAVAAAAETAPAEKAAKTTQPEPQKPIPQRSIPEEPSSVAVSTPPQNPFATAATASASPLPAAQTEPADPFAGAEPVPQSEPPAAFAEAGMMSSDETAPPAQPEPVASESPFGDGRPFARSTPQEPMAETGIKEVEIAGTEPPPASVGTVATDAAFSEAVSSDPFADAASVAPAQDMAAAPQQPIETDDPFADATAIAGDPAASNEEAVPGEQSVMDDATVAVEEVADVPVETADDVAAPPQSLFPEETAAVAAGDPFSEPMTAATGEESVPLEASDAAATPVVLEDDPFGAVETTEPAAFDPAAPAPERLEPEGSVPLVATNDEPAFTEESPFEPAAANPTPAAETLPTEMSVPAAEPATASGRTEYCLVQESDSYWSISKRVYGTPIYFHALAKFNAARIPDPKKLRPGMKVLTPAPQELAARFPNLVSDGGAGASEEEESVDSDRPGFLLDKNGNPAYRVAKDDTLTGIAQAHLGRASRWVQIYQMNRDVVPDAKTLKPGTVLRLPSDASRVRLVPEG